MHLDDFLIEFAKIDHIICENGRAVPPFLLNPKYPQKRLVTHGAEDLIYSLRTGNEKGTVINAMVQVLFECRVKDVFRIAQCYLAMIPVVLGPGQNYEMMDAEIFRSLLNSYHQALRERSHEEPFLLSDLEETSQNLYAMSNAIYKRKHYHFKPTSHNKNQANAIVRNARGENEFLGVFYRHILMPALMLPIKK